MTPPRHSTRVAAALGLALVLLLIQAENVRAQQPRSATPGDPSHRELKLPPAGPEDMLQQFRMMQQLRSLIDRQPQPASPLDDVDFSQLVGELDDEQLDAFSELMRLLPQGANLEQLRQRGDAERVQDALHDPQVRRMLEQFGRDGHFPFRGQTPRGAGPTAPDLAPPSAPSPAVDRLPNLRPVPEQPSQRPASNANRAAPAEVPPSRNLSAPNTDDRSADSVRRAFTPELQRRSIPQSQDMAVDEAQMQRVAPPRSTTLTTLPEYLQQVQRDPSILPPFNDLLPTAPQQKVDFERAAANEQVKDMLKSMMPERVASKLERNGIRKTIGDLVEQANRDVRLQQMDAQQNESSPASSTDASLLSGVEKGLLKALDGVKDSVVDLATEYASKSSKSKSKPASPSNTAANNVTLAETSSANSKSSAAANLSKSTSAFWSKLTSAPLSSVGSSSEALQDGVAAASQGSMSSPWLLALLLAACLFFLVRRRVARAWRDQAAADLPELGKIECGADVIRAFHVLAARTNVPTELWWTHSRAAAAWSHAQPALDAAHATLVQLYEQVRYSPAAHPLSPEQLDAARRAIRQCRA